METRHFITAMMFAYLLCAPAAAGAQSMAVIQVSGCADCSSRSHTLTLPCGNII